MVGIPFTKRNRQIRETAKIEIPAEMVKTIFMVFSLYFFMIGLPKKRKMEILVFTRFPKNYLQILFRDFFPIDNIANIDFFDLGGGKVVKSVLQVYDDGNAIQGDDGRDQSFVQFAGF